MTWQEGLRRKVRSARASLVHNYVGDVIAILRCSFPVLLRLDGNCYRYISETYVQEIMDGKRVKEEQEKYPREVLWQNFKLR